MGGYRTTDGPMKDQYAPEITSRRLVIKSNDPYEIPFLKEGEQVN
jgi:hypothetical protein